MVNSAYNLAATMVLRAMVRCTQHRLEEARSETLLAADAFEKLGAPSDVEECRDLLQFIQELRDVAFG